MNYFEQLAQTFGQQLIKPRKYNYSQELLEHFFVDNPFLRYRFTKIQNKRHQLLETLLVEKSSETNHPKTCIIYAHGLGSNKLQVLPILKHFKSYNYDICSFDFSGSGKSQGKFTSYGLRQQDDVSAILAWLDQNKNYHQYILWGRSMGSVAIILSQGLFLNSKVKNIIIDSPFSSFQKVSLEIASKKSFIPQILLQPLVNYLKQYFSKKVQFNPFTMKILQNIQKIDRKMLLIYSKKDSIVNCSHSQKLKVNCRHIPYQIQISQDHNMQRSKDTHIKIHNFILQNSLRNLNHKQSIFDTKEFDQTLRFQTLTNRTRSQSRGRGISLTSKQNIKQNLQIQSNRNLKSIQNNKAKINLVITQSMTINRKDFIKTAQKQKIVKIKPVSSIQFDRYSHQSSHSIKNRKSLGQPLSLLSLNSLDTIQSNNEENIKNQGSSKLRVIENQKSFLNMTQKFSINNQNNQNIQTINNYQNYTEASVQRQKETKIQKNKCFYSAQFMNENLNMLCSINSICLNKKKFKEKELNSNIKDKNISAIKRPSIQLRRKNRFVV